MKVTDEQIRELQACARAAPFDGNDLTTIWCAIALGERIGDVDKARAKCAEILEARSAEDERSVACPRCEVAAGTRCTALTHTGYKPLVRSHAARFDAFNGGKS